MNFKEEIKSKIKDLNERQYVIDSEFLNEDGEYMVDLKGQKKFMPIEGTSEKSKEEDMEALHAIMKKIAFSLVNTERNKRAGDYKGSKFIIKITDSKYEVLGTNDAGQKIEKPVIEGDLKSLGQIKNAGMNLSKGTFTSEKYAT